MKALFDEGLSFRDIAKKCMRDYSTVRSHLKGFTRVRPGKSGYAPKFDHDRAYTLWCRGHTTAQLAERFGVSQSHIQKVVKRRKRHDNA